MRFMPPRAVAAGTALCLSLAMDNMELSVPPALLPPAAQGAGGAAAQKWDAARRRWAVSVQGLLDEVKLRVLSRAARRLAQPQPLFDDDGDGAGGAGDGHEEMLRQFEAQQRQDPDMEMLTQLSVHATETLRPGIGVVKMVARAALAWVAPSETGEAIVQETLRVYDALLAQSDGLAGELRTLLAQRHPQEGFAVASAADGKPAQQHGTRAVQQAMRQKLKVCMDGVVESWSSSAERSASIAVDEPGWERFRDPVAVEQAKAAAICALRWGVAANDLDPQRQMAMSGVSAAVPALMSAGVYVGLCRMVGVDAFPVPKRFNPSLDRVRFLLRGRTWNAGIALAVWFLVHGLSLHTAKSSSQFGKMLHTPPHLLGGMEAMADWHWAKRETSVDDVAFMADLMTDQGAPGGVPAAAFAREHWQRRLGVLQVGGPADWGCFQAQPISPVAQAVIARLRDPCPLWQVAQDEMIRQLRDGSARRENMRSKDSGVQKRATGAAADAPSPSYIGTTIPLDLLEYSEEATLQQVAVLENALLNADLLPPNKRPEKWLHDTRDIARIPPHSSATPVVSLEIDLHRVYRALVSKNRCAGADVFRNPQQEYGSQEMWASTKGVAGFISLHEEILFSAGIFGGLLTSATSSVFLAHLCATSIFLLSHGVDNVRNPAFLIQGSLWAIVHQRLYLATGSVLAPMLLHFLHNIMAESQASPTAQIAVGQRYDLSSLLDTVLESTDTTPAHFASATDGSLTTFLRDIREAIFTSNDLLRLATPTTATAISTDAGKEMPHADSTTSLSSMSRLRDVYQYLLVQHSPVDDQIQFDNESDTTERDSVLLLSLRKFLAQMYDACDTRKAGVLSYEDALRLELLLGHAPDWVVDKVKSAAKRVHAGSTERVSSICEDDFAFDLDISKDMGDLLASKQPLATSTCTREDWLDSCIDAMANPTTRFAFLAKHGMLVFLLAAMDAIASNPRRYGKEQDGLLTELALGVETPTAEQLRARLEAVYAQEQQQEQ